MDSRVETFEWVCGQYESKDGTCSPRCSTVLDQLRLDVNVSSWRPTGLAVRYCLARPTLERCRLKFSLAFCVVDDDQLILIALFLDLLNVI
jgi:hypothetical protein